VRALIVMAISILRRAGVIVASAGVAAAGCGSASAAGHGGLPAAGRAGRAGAGQDALAMLPAGRVAGRSAVPWRLVGPGWTLAVVGTSAPDGEGHPKLLLIDPRGGWYVMYSWPAADNSHFMALIDWSGDRNRALFLLPGRNHTTLLGQLTLRTGQLATVTLSQNLYPASYTKPLGLQVLGTGGSSGLSLLRMSTTGQVIKWLAHGHTFGYPVMSPDGQVIAAGTTSRRVAFISNAGGVIREVAIPGADPTRGCQTVRWWNATTVLANCAKHLWLVPESGGAPTALTKRPQTQLVDAFLAGGRLYIQAEPSLVTYPGCGLGLERQQPDGSVVVLRVPGLGCSAGVLATDGARLLLLGVGQTGFGSLRWYNPATGATQILYRPRPGGQGIGWAISFGDVGADHLFGF
jgi:hypothetical protein